MRFNTIGAHTYDHSATLGEFIPGISERARLPSAPRRIIFRIKVDHNIRLANVLREGEFFTSIGHTLEEGCVIADS